MRHRFTREFQRRTLAAVGAVCLALAAIPGAAADAGLHAFFAPNDNFNFEVASGIQSVTAGQTLSGHENWSFNFNNNGPGFLNGVQMQFNSAGSGADYTNSSVFNFNYVFFPDDPNAFVPNHGCPTPTAAQETCPSPAIGLPAGDVTFFTGNGPSITGTTGYDASRTVTPIPSTTDSDVSVVVTLNASRYGAQGNEIRVTDSQANADTTYTPTVTAGGGALPNCPVDNGEGCVVPAEFGAYQYATGTGTTPCEAVSSYVRNAHAGTQYVFDWHENESGAGGCPTGEPGVGVIGWIPAQPLATLPCDSGTDCSGTRSIPGVGNVTATVASGQISGFDGDMNSLYLLNFDGASAPPAPSNAASSDYGYSETSQGTAMATNAGTTATGSGAGALTVSQFGSDPVSIPPFDSSGQYFDVQVLQGSDFSSVDIHNCNLASGDSLMWWNGTAWLAVDPQTYTPGSPGCVDALLTDTTSPTITQLKGTIFAVANTPLLTLMTNKLVLAGTNVKMRVSCTRLACRGTATLTTTKRKRTRFGRINYALAAGKTQTLTVPLTAAGKNALAHITRAKSYAALLSVTLAHGRTLLANVKIIR